MTKFLQNAIWIYCFLYTTSILNAQIKIGDNPNLINAGSLLELESTNKGLLISRISVANAATWTLAGTSVEGTLIYNTNATIIGGSGTGFYYWNGTQWTKLLAGVLSHNTLDQAYDEGGAGFGRIITADNGAVEINGTGGLVVASNNAGTGTATDITNTDGTQTTSTHLGFMSSAANSAVYGLFSIASATNINGVFGSAAGIRGQIQHPTNGTINLNSTPNTLNAAIGVAGAIPKQTSFTGTESDYVASIAGVTQNHFSSGGTVTGGVRLYAGLFRGNGRVMGLWGDNSAFMEFLPRATASDYDAAIVGFYNSAPNAGNNGASLGTPDNYLSIEANIDGTTADDLILQHRTTNGNVGIGTNSPAAKLDVEGSARVRLDMTIANYPNTRDNSGTTTPSNFLYTDASGNLLSAPTSAITGGGANTLDQAYDEGGAGAGRTITADNGAVEIQGSGGLSVGDGNTLTSGNRSMAVGDGNTVSGINSVAIGNGNIASSDYSTVFGFANRTLGIEALAFGFSNIASGVLSTASGNTNTSPSYVETVIGSFSTNYIASSANSFVASDRLFTIGNGVSNATRSNAFTIFKDGNAILAGNLTQLSDKRLKTNVSVLSGALASVLKLNGYTYNWKKAENRDTRQQVGVLAQEVEAVYPQLITKNKVGNLGVNYIGLVPVLIEATKEQQAIIDQQNKELEETKQRLSSLEKEMAEIKALLKKD